MSRSEKLLNEDQLKRLLDTDEAKKTFEFYEWTRKRLDADYWVLDDLIDVIFYMQVDLRRFEIKYPDQVEKIETAQKRIDRLLKIKDGYQSFHFTADYYIKKSHELSCNNLELCHKINEMQQEIDKLTKTLEST